MSKSRCCASGPICGGSGCCGGGSVANDKFSTFSDACYTANLEKMTEQLRKNKNRAAELINQPAADGMTPMHRAAQRGSPDVIDFLLKQRADVTSLTNSGESSLHIACFHKKRAAVEKLLQQPGILKFIDLQDQQHGMTALHVAIYRGDPDIAELLLQKGASTAIIDKVRNACTLLKYDQYGNNAIEMAEFWVGQAEQGLSSPTARHPQTLEVLQKNRANNPN